MTSARASLAACIAVARRDLHLYLSYRARFPSQLVSTVFGVALFYYVSRLVNAHEFPNPDDYFAFVVVGLAVMEILTATLHTVPATLRGELLSGTFERMVVSPFGPVGGIIALSVFPMAFALTMATFTIIVASTLFGLALHWSTVPLAVPAALLGLSAFLPLALLLAGVVLIVKQAASITNFLITGLAFASGLFFPVSVLPPELQWISEIQPLTPALELIRHALLGTPISGSAWVAVAKLAGFAAILGPVSFVVISRAIRVCMRRGTLIEY
jgi:ABC-2 type transport system permease protein